SVIRQKFTYALHISFSILNSNIRQASCGVNPPSYKLLIPSTLPRESTIYPTLYITLLTSLLNSTHHSSNEVFLFVNCFPSAINNSKSKGAITTINNTIFISNIIIPTILHSYQTYSKPKNKSTQQPKIPTSLSMA